MEKPIIKDKSVMAYVDYLESRLKVFTDSPYITPYLTLTKVVDAFNKKIGETSIDILLDDPTLTKYLSSQKKYLEQLDDFKKKMSPEDRKSLEERMRSSAGIAERIALDEKNGTGRAI